MTLITHLKDKITSYLFQFALMLIFVMMVAPLFVILGLCWLADKLPARYD